MGELRIFRDKTTTLPVRYFILFIQLFELTLYMKKTFLWIIHSNG